MSKRIWLAFIAFTAMIRIASADTLPFIGMDIGYQVPNWRLTDTSNTSINYSNTGVVGDLFVGLGTMINPKFYLALEGFGSEQSTRSSTKNISVNGAPATAMIRSQYSYGASFIPAVQVSHAVRLYGRLGVIRTRFILHQSVVPIGNWHGSTNNRNTATGGQVGIGIESVVARCLSIRGEYDYSAYRSFRSFGNKIVAKDNLFKVGFVYYLH